MCADIGDVRNPCLIRPRLIKLSSQLIGRNDGWWAAFAPGPSAIAHLGLDASIAHQAMDAIDTTGLSHIPEIIMDFAIAVDTAAFQPQLLDLAG